MSHKHLSVLFGVLVFFALNHEVLGDASAIVDEKVASVNEHGKGYNV